MLTRSLALLGMVATASISSAAEITMHEEAGQTIVTVSGKLANYDARLFQSLAANVHLGTVLLNSTGGSAYAAVEIGKTIRRLGMATKVLSQVGPCKSACALIWLAGQPRQLDTNAKIGFHAAFEMREGRPVVSGPANALLGAYMRDLALNDAVISFATEAAPGSMKYVTETEARKIGLQVQYIDDAAANERAAADSFIPAGVIPIPASPDSDPIKNP